MDNRESEHKPMATATKTRERKAPAAPTNDAPAAPTNDAPSLQAALDATGVKIIPDVAVRDQKR